MTLNDSILALFYDPEAHPTESGDYIDYFLPINKHNTLEERLSAASKKIFIYLR